MPRISSTSCMTGTGFMKWKPMNFSGRSVRAGQPGDRDRRGVRGQDRGRFQMRQQVLEDRLLDRLALGRGLDDQIGLAKIGQRLGGRDPGHGRGPVFGRDDLAADLPVKVAVDQRHGRAQRLAADIGHQHLVSGQRKDMGDAVAHLPRADNADLLDTHHSPFLRSARTICPDRPGHQGEQTAKKPIKLPLSRFGKADVRLLARVN